MSKNNRRRKGKSNEEVLKSVLGEKYVSQYSETTSDELKAKQGSDVTRAPTKKKISVMPVSFPNDETSGVPQPSTKEPIKKASSNSKAVSADSKKLPSKEEKISNIPKLDIPLNEKIYTAVRGFNKSCDELKVDFKKEQIIFKKDGTFQVFNFKGEKILAYTFDGKYII